MIVRRRWHYDILYSIEDGPSDTSFANVSGETLTSPKTGGSQCTVWQQARTINATRNSPTKSHAATRFQPPA